MKLSILDYAVIDENKTALEALVDSVELAKLADELGYSRFWMAEHHDVPALSSTSPELLMLHLLNNTKNIQIGSGGIMIPHYSPYKIAEWIKWLSALYPKRVNLGIGNNPGTRKVQNLMRTTPLLRAEYNERCEELVGYLYKNSEIIHPKETAIEPFWLLSTSEKSARLAAELEQNYVYGLFFNQTRDYLETAKRCLETYRSEMKRKNKEPRDILAVFVVIGEDEQEVLDLVKVLDIWLLGKKEFSEFNHFPSITTAKKYTLSEEDNERIEKNRTRLVWGTKEEVLRRLRVLEKELELDEIMCIPLVPTIEKRKRTIKILADEFLRQKE